MVNFMADTQQSITHIRRRTWPRPQLAMRARRGNKPSCLHTQQSTSHILRRKWFTHPAVNHPRTH
eukprot:546366-Pelagomonas_calceolata.AAC.2